MSKWNKFVLAAAFPLTFFAGASRPDPPERFTVIAFSPNANDTMDVTARWPKTLQDFEHEVRNPAELFDDSVDAGKIEWFAIMPRKYFVCNAKGEPEKVDKFVADVKEYVQAEWEARLHAAGPLWALWYTMRSPV